MNTNTFTCHRCGQTFLPGALTHICGTTSMPNDTWQSVQRDLAERDAELKRLQGELMDANPGDLEQCRDHAASLELAIDKTWRPEVQSLRAANENLQVALKAALEQNERFAAEIQRLLVDNAELSTECDQWGEKVADCWREIARLRLEVT